MKFKIPHIIFETTQQCNLSCLYCYNHWQRRNQTLKESNFKETTKTLKKLLEVVDFKNITFTGGEPFLADGLSEFVLQCRMKAKGVTIISNGTVASYDNYKTMHELGVSLFEFPLHADNPDIHDSLTGIPGSFEKVLNSIHTLKKLKTEVCVVFVITNINLDYLQRTIDFAEKLGIQQFMLARFNIGGRGIINKKKLIPTLSDLRDAFSIANNYAAANTIAISANVCTPHCLLNPKDFPNIPMSSCGIELSLRPITIDFSGNMRMCNHSPHCIGNIHSDDITSLFSSEYVMNWQTARPSFCSNCKDWNICKGGCKAASEQMGKTIYDEDPIIDLLLDKLPFKTNLIFIYSKYHNGLQVNSKYLL